MFHTYLIRGLEDQNDFRHKLRILFAARRIQHLLKTKATSQKSNPYPSLEEKGALLACLWLSFWNEKHLKWLLEGLYSGGQQEEQNGPSREKLVASKVAKVDFIDPVVSD